MWTNVKQSLGFVKAVDVLILQAVSAVSAHPGKFPEMVRLDPVRMRMNVWSLEFALMDGVLIRIKATIVFVIGDSFHHKIVGSV